MLRSIHPRVIHALEVVASITVGAWLIGACAGDPTGPADCDQSTAVSISPGLEPTFSWPSGCRAQFVIVERVYPTYQEMWFVSSSTNVNENVFGSPIQYGRLPTTGDALVTRGPIPLVSGGAYQLTLISAGRLGSRNGVKMAQFVP